jgi:hypothetical protein
VCRAVSSTVVISPENQLWLPCYHFKNEGLPIDGKLYDLYKFSPEVRRFKQQEGRMDFCQGCTVYCYMRNSLVWKYPVSSVLMNGHYFRERVRQNIRNRWSPPEPTVIPPPSPKGPAVRRLPIMVQGSDPAGE